MENTGENKNINRPRASRLSLKRKGPMNPGSLQRPLAIDFSEAVIQSGKIVPRSSTPKEKCKTETNSKPEVGLVTVAGPISSPSRVLPFIITGIICPVYFFLIIYRTVTTNFKLKCRFVVNL